MTRSVDSSAGCQATTPTRKKGRKRIEYAALKSNLKRIEEDYIPNRDVFCDDDMRVARLKMRVSRLNEIDRRIILLYAELASCRKLGILLGVSYRTAMNIVNRIKKELLSQW